MYQLPLRFIRISEDVSICATRIVAMMSTDTYQARNLIRDEKRAGTLINGAGRAAVKTAIVLDNGTIVASPLSIRRLMTAIERSNAKDPGKVKADSVRLKVYTVGDEEPDPELDEEVPEVGAELGAHLPEIPEEELIEDDFT